MAPPTGHIWPAMRNYKGLKNHCDTLFHYKCLLACLFLELKEKLRQPPRREWREKTEVLAEHETLLGREFALTDTQPHIGCRQSSLEHIKYHGKKWLTSARSMPALCKPCNGHVTPDVSSFYRRGKTVRKSLAQRRRARSDGNGVQIRPTCSDACVYTTSRKEVTLCPAAH